MKKLFTVLCALFVALAFAAPGLAAETSTKAPHLTPKQKPLKPDLPKAKSDKTTTSQGSSTSESKDGSGSVGKKVESKDDGQHKKD